VHFDNVEKKQNEESGGRLIKKRKQCDGQTDYSFEARLAVKVTIKRDKPRQERRTIACKTEKRTSMVYKKNDQN
jgi:hypothetical protein